MFVKLFAVGLLASLSVATKLQYPEKNPCILIDLTANNTLEWKSNETEKVPNWGFSDSKVIGGDCSAPNPYLEVKWDIDNATMTFNFSKNASNQASVDMTLSFNPSIVFSKFNNTDNSTVEISVTYELGTADKAFKCNAEQTEKEKKEEYDMTLRIKDLMIQGYNVKDGNFSAYEECKADPTPSPTPKPSPTTPPQKMDKVYMNATDGNNTCAMVAGKFQFMIQYKTTKKTTETVTVDVLNKGLTSKGNCSSPKENVLQATFNDYFNVMFDFKSDGSNFWLKRISLAVPLDSPYFPNSASKSTETVFVEFDDNTKQYKASNSGSYMCNSESKLNLNSTVTLKMTDFQYAAFQKNITSFKDSNISECSADAKTSSIVPIAVGAALAGLVVIVLIAYLIGRRRNRKGYESV